MTTTVDARGLPCPQPVIQTRKAMQTTERVVTLVDNETSVTNVSRMASRAGWQVNVISEGDDFRIEMARQAGASEKDAAPQSVVARPEEAGPAGGPLVLVVSDEGMGQGEAELGHILIRSFFHTLGEVEPRPQVLLFFNSGVKLTCEGSPILEDLRALEEAGCELLVCGTCLGYYEIQEELAVGQVSNMYDIAEAMLNAGKVVHL